ncbi:MAG: RNA polymerase sigma factor RpoH [Burkholderiales bacterium]|jgi:RNA polymerase sigma-32 factor|nr:RNA polymerase sigma factor RpoH [Burkholderiales bacterium]MCA3155863.1 RNA polymerase sigma factor RpoH [Burkholderiales bacterium]MCA3155899.1 RNA polymerase sigma factor RpoH [Burkholderiales bacterium]MCA3168807.1 RNA polymerase sigma factor RpoH [Burkholderiales bacterium]
MTTALTALTHGNALAVSASSWAKFDLPVPVGNLEAYISAVHRIPLLSQDEELALARRLQQEGDLDAARHLVLSHLRLVVSVARQYLGYGLPHADLIQEGNIGLMKAVKRFDPERGVRLVSFALHWIKAEIHEYIVKNWRLVKIATTKAQRKLFFNLRSMKQGLGSLGQDEIDAIANELNVKREEVIEMETRLGGGDVALEGQIEDGEESYAPIAYLRDEQNEPGYRLEARERDALSSDGLNTALAALDARSRRIVESRWLAEPGEEKTLHDLADEFGVSAERIRQIETAALKKMKGSLAEFQAA